MFPLKNPDLLSLKKPLLKYVSCGTDSADLLVALHHLTQAAVCQHCLGIGPDGINPSHHVVPFTTHMEFLHLFSEMFLVQN